MNQVYDFKRMMLFARLKFSLNKKALMLRVLGYFALLFIIGFFIAYANRNLTNEVPFFTLFHIIGLSYLTVYGLHFMDTILTFLMDFNYLISQYFLKSFLAGCCCIQYFS